MVTINVWRWLLTSYFILHTTNTMVRGRALSLWNSTTPVTSICILFHVITQRSCVAKIFIVLVTVIHRFELWSFPHSGKPKRNSFIIMWFSVKKGLCYYYTRHTESNRFLISIAIIKIKIKIKIVLHISKHSTARAHHHHYLLNLALI